jgi:hypothetical protein
MAKFFLIICKVYNITKIFAKFLCTTGRSNGITAKAVQYICTCAVNRFVCDYLSLKKIEYQGIEEGKSEDKTAKASFTYIIALAALGAGGGGGG